MIANFIKVSSMEELDELFEKSGEQPVFLFKHSLTCPISAGVFEIVSGIDADIYLIVVQHSRDISNEIATRTGVRHESPQAVILKDSKAVYHASHYDVTAQEIEEILKETENAASAAGE
jgi:bacillithiol system protein YtxJ